MSDENKYKIDITVRTLKTSPSISRLFKAYKSYIIEQVLSDEPIVDLEKFYWAMKRAKAIPTSRIYEKYLRRVLAKQTGLDPDEIE